MITTAKFIAQETFLDGTLVNDQILVLTENSDGSTSTHRYPQSEELSAWLAEGNEPLPAD